MKVEGLNTNIKLLNVYPYRCTACRNCEIACSFRHIKNGMPSPSRINAISDEQKRQGKNIIVVCMQCDKAACVKACPVNALQRNESTGAIVHIESRCIGCGSCVQACPFGNMKWDFVSSRPVKCDLCGGDPMCAKFCPEKALVYE